MMSNFLNDALDLEEESKFLEAAKIYEVHDMHLQAQAAREIADNVRRHNWTAPYESKEVRAKKYYRHLRKTKIQIFFAMLGMLVLCYIVLSPFIAMWINRLAGY
jgi:predicted anti-sigma-YlaC factor YlaD